MHDLPGGCRRQGHIPAAVGSCGRRSHERAAVRPRSMSATTGSTVRGTPARKVAEACDQAIAARRLALSDPRPWSARGQPSSTITMRATHVAASARFPGAPERALGGAAVGGPPRRGRWRNRADTVTTSPRTSPAIAIHASAHCCRHMLLFKDWRSQTTIQDPFCGATSRAEVRTIANKRFAGERVRADVRRPQLAAGAGLWRACQRRSSRVTIYELFWQSAASVGYRRTAWRCLTAAYPRLQTRSAGGCDGLDVIRLSTT